jgi:hypothetical protein
VLWRQLRPRNPHSADMSSLAAVGYALAGGLGAAVLAMVAPMMMQAYTDAAAAGQALIAAQFATASTSSPTPKASAPRQAPKPTPRTRIGVANMPVFAADEPASRDHSSTNRSAAHFLG